MKISAFSFGHNLIEGGYPIREAVNAVRPFVDEVVVADLESTDGTRQVLEKLGVRILKGKWGNKAGETLKEAHALHVQCDGDIILAHEADEVFDPHLASWACFAVRNGQIGADVRFWRIQVSQNFQRVRWWPHPVHRMFPKGSVVKDGETTDRNEGFVVPQEHGYLWDVTNCFRDNWMGRVRNQAELWDEEPTHRMVPRHFMQVPVLHEAEALRELEDERWTWKVSPFALPDILKSLVGRTKYDGTL